MPVQGVYQLNELSELFKQFWNQVNLLWLSLRKLEVLYHLSNLETRIKNYQGLSYLVFLATNKLANKVRFVKTMSLAILGNFSHIKLKETDETKGAVWPSTA